MFRLEMSKSYPFSSEIIDRVITMTAAGNFALGEIEDSGEFVVGYVGWADRDLKSGLKAMLGNRYKAFRYSYALTPKDAFEKECRIYHDLGGNIILDNTEHPARPEGVKWPCPVCG